MKEIIISNAVTKLACDKKLHYYRGISYYELMQNIGMIQMPKSQAHYNRSKDIQDKSVHIYHWCVTMSMLSSYIKWNKPMNIIKQIIATMRMKQRESYIFKIYFVQILFFNSKYKCMKNNMLGILEKNKPILIICWSLVNRFSVCLLVCMYKMKHNLE